MDTSLVKSMTMPLADDPMTLRRLISLARCSVAKEVRPNNPRQAIKIARTEKASAILAVLFSSL
jgi:hypothetical protein